MVGFSRICSFVGAVTLVVLQSFTANGDEIVSSSSITSKSFDSVYNDDNDNLEEGIRRLGGYYSVYNDYDKYYGYDGKTSSGSSDSDSSGSKRGSGSSSGGDKGGSSSGYGSKSGSKSSSDGSGSQSGSSSDSNNKGYYGKMSKYNKYGKGGYGDNSDSSSSSGRKGSGSGSDSSSGNGKGRSSSSSSRSKSKSGSKSGSGSDSSSSGRRKDGKRGGKRGGRKDDPKDDDNDKNDDERFALRINCGGLGTDDYCEDYRYFNVNGDLWFHDCEYQDDYDAEIFSVDDTIYDIDEYGNEVEADDQEIYQSERFIREKDLVYNFDVNNGRYFIKLYFAENFFSTRKERVFDIAVQGEILEYDLDIYERVGKNFALVLQFNDIYVDDYKLTIEFIKNIQDPKVNGIEIFQVE